MSEPHPAYNPGQPLDAKWWTSLDEPERIDAILQYHRQTGDEIPNEEIHAAIHNIIENQILLGDEIPVSATHRRLMDEGLDRHDALHAIGSVLVPFLFDTVQQEMGETRPADNNARYYQQLEELTADGWLAEYS
jgi:hypothetical protein